MECWFIRAIKIACPSWLLESMYSAVAVMFRRLWYVNSIYPVGAPFEGTPQSGGALFFKDKSNFK